MLRLYDPRSGRPEALPGGRVLRVRVLDGAGLRTLIVADLLRRVAGRAGRHVQVTASREFMDGGPADYARYNVQPLDAAGDAAGADPPDLYVSGEREPPVDGFCVTAPHETGDWRSAGETEALAVRLAMLEAPYREPLDLSAARLARARGRLDGWRGEVAGWASSPGRPIDRAYAARAEAALADDLDGPSALAVLDALASDPDVPPGAKLETFVHLDLLFGLDLVAAIGRA
ncbi:hypothetical protein AGRA3207_005848 [Actinomadura graeca]|uniref:Uncharacterized protein n=1 Tax=Actinomadura graeca TaxID=2750812 RepID=A0ABX8R0H6_9ACTN|nr:hypothetical protein [Actinomadura graeca]QXJ24512.1 hypothetical protein AGRA3207_005848 [Actinomadura graeca]